MGVPLFSDEFLTGQAAKLVESPMTLVRGLDEHDWALLRPAELTAQLEAALSTQAAVGAIHARSLDPKSSEARGLIVSALTRTLSPFAQQCVYDLDSHILLRATRFSETYDGGILTIRVFRRSPDSSPPTEDQIGVCHARFDSSEQEGCDHDLINSLDVDNDVDDDGDDNRDDDGDDDLPELVYPAPISVYDPDLLPLSHARTSTAHLPPPFSPAQASHDDPAGPTASASAASSTPDFMSPSAGVFHAHTLDLPLEAPPPAARRASPQTAATYPTIHLAPPPMRAFYPRSSSPDSSSSSRTIPHAPPPAPRGLGHGWADEARRQAATRAPPPARTPNSREAPELYWGGGGAGLIADEALVHIAHEVFQAQAREAARARGEANDDPSGEPPLEPGLATRQRQGAERRDQALRGTYEQAVQPLEWRGRYGQAEEVEGEES